jgi:hypothetical protein
MFAQAHDAPIHSLTGYLYNLSFYGREYEVCRYCCFFSRKGLSYFDTLVVFLGPIWPSRYQ